MSRKRRLPQAICSISLSFVLAVGLTPTAAYANPQPSAWSWGDEIPELIQAGAYEEGSVVAVVNQSRAQRISLLALTNDITGRADASDGEKVMDLGAEAVADSVNPENVTLTSADNATYAVITITDPSKTTEQLLYELASDPSVIFAEPNYLAESASFDQGTPLEVSAAEPAESTDPTPDESAADEAADDTSSAEEASAPDADDDSPALPTPEIASLAAADSTTEFDPVVTDGNALGNSPMANGSLTDLQYSLNSNTTLKTAGAQAGAASINASNWNSPEGNMARDVVVAVLDSGADYNNPDLTNKLVTFTSEQQEQLNCGQYGYNAVEGEDPRDVSEVGSHGTHCAGVIGAEWNDFGISGAGSNTRILNIRASDSKGRTSLINEMNGFAFVEKAIEAGIPVEVTSNSYGLDQVSRALNAIVYQVGSKYNVTSVFAAGNSAMNLDHSAFINHTFAENPYVVMVAASDSDDKLAAYSNYGVQTVDLGAPGSAIYSTYPVSESHYIPDADAATDRLYYNGFEAEDEALTFSQVNPLTSQALPTSTSAYSQIRYSGEQCQSVFLDKPWCGIRGLDFYAVESSEVKANAPEAGQTAYFGITLYANAAGGMAPATLDGTTTNNYVFETRTTNGTWANISYDKCMRVICRYEAWETLSCALPENTDFEHFQIRIGLLLSASDKGLDVCFDSFGVGTHVAPYETANGTSMACPLVAGAMAIQASEYAIDAPQNNAAERIKRIEASTRQNATFTGMVATGGVLDLSVSESATAPEKALTPVITDTNLQGTTLTITGANFGNPDAAGTATVQQHGLAQEGPTLSSSVRSWSDDRIVVDLAKEPTGILSVTVANANGKTFTSIVFAKCTEAVYENDLAVPDESITPGIQGLDDFTASETAGCMVGLQGKLYYLPLQTQIERMPFSQRMWVYDIASNTWQTAAALPEPLENASATIFEGLLVVEGETMAFEGKSPVSASNKSEVVYVFNPQLGTWVAGCADNLSLGSTLFNLQGQVLAVGGTDGQASTMQLLDDETQPKPSHQIVKFDPSAGAGEVIATTHLSFTNPRACASDSSVFLYQLSQEGEKCELATPGEESQQVHMPNFLPRSSTERSFAALADGVMMIGPASEDGTTDTYQMATGATVFSPYNKRVSDGKVFFPASCAYDGQLYVMAASEIEPAKRLFRSTAVQTVTDPNDVSLAPDPSPTPAPTPAPSSGGSGTPAASPATGDDLSSLALAALLASLTSAIALTAFACTRKRSRH